MNAYLELGYQSPDDDSSSVDTHDAFLEMFGLKEDVIGMEEMENTVQDPFTVISFPTQCSRHGYHSKDCFGLIIDNVMNEENCRLLIELAEASGFRYIREATHFAPDGSSYTVRLQNPNPHKLSAIDTHHLDHDTDSTFLESDYNIATNLLNALYQSIYTHIISNELFHKFVEREKCGPPIGLNPRIRVLKYDAEDNDSFQPHFDASTLVQNGSKRSLVTVLLYLNNSGQGMDYQGGNTLFTNYSTDMLIAGNQYQTHMKTLKHLNRDSPRNSCSYTEVKPILGRVVLFEHDMFHSGEPLQWGRKYILRTDILFRNDIKEQNIIAGRAAIIGKESSLVDETIPNNKKPFLISDICAHMNLSSNACKVLNDLGLYACTCDAFLAPGFTALTVILVDHGIDRETVHELIQEVVMRNKH